MNELTDDQALQLEYAQRYFHDAPADCWTNYEIFQIVISGRWGNSVHNPTGGLLGRKFNGYTFKYRGIPIGGIFPNGIY